MGGTLKKYTAVVLFRAQRQLHTVGGNMGKISTANATKTPQPLQPCHWQVTAATAMAEITENCSDFYATAVSVVENCKFCSVKQNKYRGRLYNTNKINEE